MIKRQPPLMREVTKGWFTMHERAVTVAEFKRLDSMADDPNTHKVSMWVPETNPLVIGVLGKLIEETTECATAAARCLEQGINECEPETGKLNKTWLEQEIADVRMMCDHAENYLQLDKHAIETRRLWKFEFKNKWFAWLSQLGKAK